MNTVTVQAHTRKRPFADQREKTTAALRAYVESQVDKQIAAAFRPFAINVWRSMRKAG